MNNQNSLSETQKLQEALSHIRNVIKICHEPRVGIVCGSGLGKLSTLISNTRTVSYSSIPHFVTSTVAGHSGEFVFGEFGGVELVCMRGRVHLYEGYQPADCVRPIRLMALLGIKILIATNAAGSVASRLIPGDFMIIKDHISFPSLAGFNPLRGPHSSTFGERFVGMQRAYDAQLIRTIRRLANERFMAPTENETTDHQRQPIVTEGVYAMVSGPTYETVAEARMLRTLGADAVGMSTAHEITVASQMGVRCLAISLITNKVATSYDMVHNAVDCFEHESVCRMADSRSNDLLALIEALLIDLKTQDDNTNKHQLHQYTPADSACGDESGASSLELGEPSPPESVVASLCVLK